ncbi:MAG: glycosyltransferase family 4 protein [candidate division Zixibacteria bacterium]
MKKLLVLSDGRSIHTERWCRYFEQNDFEVALFSLEEISILGPKIKYQGSRPTGRGLIDYSLAKNHFRIVVESFNPDIINAHYVNSYGWLASHTDKCPVIVTAWGSDLLIVPQKSKMQKRRVAQALSQAHYCTVDSHNLFEAANEYIDAQKIIKIIMGIGREFFEYRVKKDYGNNEIIRILSPRGFQPVYNPETIIAAAERLKEKFRFHIDMLGDSSNIEKYSAIIEDRNLSSHIKIKNRLPREEFEKSLSDYDIYLSASRSDSTSVSLLEAMSVGLLPVVSDIPGNREWITDYHNGYLFETGNVASLTEKLTEVLKGKIDFDRIAQINRSLIQEKAIWQDNMSKLKKLFLDISCE